MPLAENLNELWLLFGTLFTTIIKEHLTKNQSFEFPLLETNILLHWEYSRFGAIVLLTKIYIIHGKSSKVVKEFSLKVFGYYLFGITWAQSP